MHCTYDFFPLFCFSSCGLQKHDFHGKNHFTINTKQYALAPPATVQCSLASHYVVECLF